jgi:hypothetical protein
MSSLINLPKSPIIFVDFLNYIKKITGFIRQGENPTNLNTHLTTEEFCEVVRLWVTRLVILLYCHLNAQGIVFVSKMIKLDTISTELEYQLLFFRTLRRVEMFDLDRIFFVITPSKPRNADDLTVIRLARSFNDSIVLSDDRYNKPDDKNRCPMHVNIYRNPYKDCQPRWQSLSSYTHVYSDFISDVTTISFGNETDQTHPINQASPQLQIGFRLVMGIACRRCYRPIKNRNGFCNQNCRAGTYSVANAESLEIIM